VILKYFHTSLKISFWVFIIKGDQKIINYMTHGYNKNNWLKKPAGSGLWTQMFMGFLDNYWKRDSICVFKKFKNIFFIKNYIFFIF
jgi:hypothetical protein